MGNFWFLKLKETLNSYNFPWYKGPILEENEKIQMVHKFYEFGKVLSDYFYLLNPCLELLNVKELARVKCNLILKTPKIEEHGFHIDYEAVVDGEVQETHNCFTSILYLNTNDGYTEFENGTKIESIENRLITFPLSYRHTGTTCTNYPFRSVINFNYF